MARYDGPAGRRKSSTGFVLDAGDEPARDGGRHGPDEGNADDHERDGD